MIIVSIFGMDYYEAISKTKKLHKPLLEAYGIKDEELEFFAPESFIIHNGFEQTSFRLNIRVEAPLQYQDKEKEVKEILLEGLKDVAIHFRILFTYFDPAHEYLSLDDTYPLYMNDSNTVKAETEEEADEKEEEQNREEEQEEPYMGDIISEFDEYIQAHPNASSEEVYKALTGIREKVTAEHHETKDEEEEAEDDDSSDDNNN